MDTALSLELIKQCLEMDLMSRDCTKVMYDPDTQAFLKKQSENQDSILQRLNEEKSRVDEYIDSITRKEAVETKLVEAATRVAIEQQKYNNAESNAQQAALAYDAQVNHVNGINGQLTATSQELVRYDRCPCPRRNQLRVQKQTQEQQLKQAKEDLVSKALDKTTKDQLKISAHAQLQSGIALKDKVESEFKVLVENEIKIKTYETEFNSASQEATNIQEMLNRLSALKDEADNDEDVEQDIEAGEFEETEMDSATNDAAPDYQYEL